MNGPKIRLLDPKDNDDENLVTAWHPDGAYIRRNTKHIGWIQIIIVGPMPHQPVDYVEQASIELGEKFDVAHLCAMALADEPELRKLMMQRGFWSILAKTSYAEDFDIPAFETST